jgi:GTPase SAR1 family protein
MSKKIIFVGPPGAGKTTLRKIFFEGESSTKLLEYAIDPTYGEESLILRLPGLNQDVGIFDLAGQENERWLNSNEKSIFIETKLILVVIDITFNSEEIVGFINKILNIRNEITASSQIFVLLHKIDLVSEKKIRDIKSIMKIKFSDENLLDFLFTSLKREYFTQTFSYFIKIIKICIDDINSDEGLLFNMVDESIKIIYQIEKEVVLTKSNLYKKLNRPVKLVDHLIESLIRNGHIERRKFEDKVLLSLTNKGKLLYKKILNDFSTNINGSCEIISNNLETLYNGKIPPIIGAVIANKDGISLLNFESFDNAISKFISQCTPKDGAIIPVELDLIPMFISALEKFSLELNIQDLTGFGLKGSNLRMHIFSYEEYTVTVFMNPNINFKAIEYKIDNFFRHFFEENKEKFKISLKSGKLDEILPLRVRGEKWLEDLNKIYCDMIISSEIIDNEQAQELYARIDELYDEINQEFSLTLEKLKKIKVDMMKSIIEKDYEELYKIANIIQTLKSKFIS